MLLSGVIMPAGGFALGGSYGARGIAFTVAYAWMWVSTTPDGKNFGDAVAPKADPQLRTGASRALIIAASYTFDS